MYFWSNKILIIIIITNFWPVAYLQKRSSTLYWASLNLHRIQIHNMYPCTVFIERPNPSALWNIMWKECNNIFGWKGPLLCWLQGSFSIDFLSLWCLRFRWRWMPGAVCCIRDPNDESWGTVLLKKNKQPSLQPFTSVITIKNPYNNSGENGPYIENIPHRDFHFYLFIWSQK